MRIDNVEYTHVYATPDSTGNIIQTMGFTTEIDVAMLPPGTIQVPADINIAEYKIINGELVTKS